MCARVCARRVCVKSHPFQLLGTGREASASGRCRPDVPGDSSLGVELPQGLRLGGTAARGAAPSQPTNCERVVSDREQVGWVLLKARP